MPEAGDYLLKHVGFSKEEKPILILQKDTALVPFTPLGHTLSLAFDTTQRFCAGWYDMQSGADHPCPESAAVPAKYDQCPACQKRTGFNPAFYHATSISKQQEARNQEPHFLYLAHFGPSVMKVGISYAGRGKARLLEQGARSALVLDTFPTANVARSYESKIAALSGVAETVQLKKKITELQKPYDAAAATRELTNAQAFIEGQLQASFAKNDPLHFDPLYFPSAALPLSEAFDCSDQSLISGRAAGMLGTLLFCLYQDVPVFLPLKKYVGYRVRLSHGEMPIALPARQTSLF